MSDTKTSYNEFSNLLDQAILSLTKLSNLEDLNREDYTEEELDLLDAKIDVLEKIIEEG